MVMIQQAARIAAMPTSEDENLTTIAANHGNNGYSYQPGVMTNQATTTTIATRIILDCMKWKSF